MNSLFISRSICADDTRLLSQNERGAFPLRVGIRIRSAAAPIQEPRLSVTVRRSRASPRRSGKFGSTVDRDQGRAFSLFSRIWQKVYSLTNIIEFDRLETDSRWFIVRRTFGDDFHVRRKRRYDEEQDRGTITNDNCTKKILISMRFNNIGKVFWLRYQRVLVRN